MKRNSLSRVMSVLLCAFMVLSMMSSTALAASKTSGKCGKNAKWSFNKKNHTLTISGKGKMKNYNITHDDYDYVFEANTPWESQKGSTKRIVIKKGVTYIGELAFSFCNAKTVSIPKTVKKIGSWSFYGCGLKSVTIPEGVSSIGVEAFAYATEMRSITIPKSVKKIGRMAVGYCDPVNEEVDENFVIYGYKGTAAEKYAKKNHITFKRLK